MTKTLSVNDFFKMFPDDAACLEHVMRARYGHRFACPKCGKEGNWKKLAKLPAYGCQWCGHHVHPMKGTLFERSSTPLQKWFYALYLFTTTRHGVSAKELQRQLSVTYKTAWRMGHQIRKYLAELDGDPPLSGTVEADETLIGGKIRGKGTGFKIMGNKAMVFGMVERGGDAMLKIVEDRRANTLNTHIEENIVKGSEVHTDELNSYQSLGRRGYKHATVDHGRKEWVRGRIHTNTIENIWGQLKRSIRGTHIHVSTKHLDKYLGEFEFRFNLRKHPHLMFATILAGFCKQGPKAV